MAVYGANPTYHDCHTTTIDHGPQTQDYYPCLNPDVFNPTDLDPDDWMRASSAMGMKVICLTAHHEGRLRPLAFEAHKLLRGGVGLVPEAGDGPARQR